jgi:hypothetical protein
MELGKARKLSDMSPVQYVRDVTGPYPRPPSPPTPEIRTFWDSKNERKSLFMCILIKSDR